MFVAAGFLLMLPGFFIGPSYANSQAASSITVSSPNGGDEWISGQTYRITWQATEVDFVQIYIFDDSSVSSGSTNYVVPNNGTVQANFGYYDWVVPDVNQLPGGGGNYKIRVQDSGDGSIIDKSDNYFSVVSAPSITVTSPNGGEQWEKSKTYDILWTIANDRLIGNEISLHLSKKNDPSVSFTINVPRPPYFLYSTRVGNYTYQCTNPDWMETRS